MTREEELTLIKKECDEMEKCMTDMFDLAFMLNNRNDIMNPKAHYKKLSRMVTHYMSSIQQSYGYMSDKAIKALEQEHVLDKVRAEIEQNAYPIVHGVNNRELGMTLYGILQVIDKHTAESEGEK